MVRNYDTFTIYDAMKVHISMSYKYHLTIGSKSEAKNKSIFKIRVISIIIQFDYQFKPQNRYTTTFFRPVPIKSIIL